MMTPEHRLAAVLFGSFLLWVPALDAMVSDELEPGAALIRYGAAVAFVWAAVRIVERIVHGYVTPPVEVEAETSATDPDNDGALDAGRRRREDTEAASAVEPEVEAAGR